MQTEEIERINEKESLKIRKIRIRHRVPHERRQWKVPTTDKLLSILAHSFNFVISQLYLIKNLIMSL